MVTPRILIVEDERIVAISLQGKLQRLGYAVPALAASGELAIQKAEQFRPDLVLMDICLEGEMDGIQAGTHIRERLGIPVVYLTAYSNEEIVERAKVTEPYGYILKPYEDRELHLVLSMALNKHRLEQKLVERERWFAATLRSIGDGVLATDCDGRVAFLNAAAERLTGWTCAEAAGRNEAEVFRIVNESTRAPVESPLPRAIRDRVSVPLANHTVLIARDKVERPIDDCAAPIADEAGRLLGGVLIFRDVSERKQLEDQLRQAQKLEAIGRLAGGVAHDFNNLLTIINGYSYMVLRTLPAQDRNRGLIQEIGKAGERAAELTGQLLAYSRKQLLQLRVVDLNHLVRDMGRMLGRLIGADVKLVWDLGPQLHRVKADPSQLEQVLLNLAVNSRDAMPAGGTLTIVTRNIEKCEVRSAKCEVRGDDCSSPRTSPLASRTVEDGEVPAGPYILLQVSDTGCGIDRYTLAKIFDPFFTTKEPGKGTGLGLAMVHGIVTRNGGTIRVESEPGRGTRFSIYLPVCGERGRLSGVQPTRPDMPAGSETLLLVEDEESVRVMMRTILAERGYRVLEAASGAEALEVATRHAGTIDLLATDIVMPGMNGGQLAEALRQQRPGVKALFLSGYGDDSLARQGILEAEAAFLQKPFQLAALAQKVRAVLDGKGC